MSDTEIIEWCNETCQCKRDDCLYFSAATELARLRAELATARQSHQEILDSKDRKHAARIEEARAEEAEACAKLIEEWPIPNGQWNIVRTADFIHAIRARHPKQEQSNDE